MWYYEILKAIKEWVAKKVAQHDARLLAGGVPLDAPHIVLIFRLVAWFEGLVADIGPTLRCSEIAEKIIDLLLEYAMYDLPTAQRVLRRTELVLRVANIAGGINFARDDDARLLFGLSMINEKIKEIVRCRDDSEVAALLAGMTDNYYLVAASTRFITPNAKTIAFLNSATAAELDELIALTI